MSGAPFSSVQNPSSATPRGLGADVAWRTIDTFRTTPRGGPLAENPQYLAKLIITRLDQSQESIETKVKGKSIEDVKRKVGGVLSLMEDGDL